MEMFQFLSVQLKLVAGGLEIKRVVVSIPLGSIKASSVNWLSHVAVKFQFLSVQLKQYPPVSGLIKMSGFNSSRFN